MLIAGREGMAKIYKNLQLELVFSGEPYDGKLSRTVRERDR